MNQYSTGWTDVRVTKLRGMLRRGCTDRQIASELGVSVRAVIGKRQRMRLEVNRARVPQNVVAAREVNERPWEPPPGMIKRRCARCQYLFAAWDDEISLCLECVISQPTERTP